MENKDSFANKSQDFLKQQGFYIVLALCLLIVGVAIALTALPREEAAEPNAQTTPQQQLQAVESRQSGDEALAGKTTTAPSATPAATPAPTLVPTAPPAPASAGRAVAKGRAPVEGSVIWGYAMDQLLYSVTLDQWTTHPGIDIACEQGTEVKAAIAGTVTAVYEDDALGMCVAIEHTNGRSSLYANLARNIPVAEGKKVNAGDVIGTVGDTALSECSALPHLHFGFFVDGKPVSPMDYVTIPH